MQIATLLEQFMQHLKIELLPFSSENLFLMLYKYTSEQAEINYILKEINIYAKIQLICIKYDNIRYQ